MGSAWFGLNRPIKGRSLLDHFCPSPSSFIDDWGCSVLLEGSFSKMSNNSGALLPPVISKRITSIHWIKAFKEMRINGNCISTTPWVTLITKQSCVAASCFDGFLLSFFGEKNLLNIISLASKLLIITYYDAMSVLKGQKRIRKRIR